MSWDAHIENKGCRSCGHRPHDVEIGNYTHNTDPMVRRAMEAAGTLRLLGEDHLYSLDGLPCPLVVHLLKPAIDWWRENQDKMSDLEPENGWGNSERALSFWGGLVTDCEGNPLGKLRLCG